MQAECKKSTWHYIRKSQKFLLTKQIKNAQATFFRSRSDLHDLLRQQSEIWFQGVENDDFLKFWGVLLGFLIFSFLVGFGDGFQFPDMFSWPGMVPYCFWIGSTWKTKKFKSHPPEWYQNRHLHIQLSGDRSRIRSSN